MAAIDGPTSLAAFAMVVAGVVWLVRLEGRINLTAAQFLEIIRRLDRIEKRQDAEPFRNPQNPA